MTRHVHHDLKIAPTRGERARQDFVSSLRLHILNDMAAHMKQRYETRIEPRAVEKSGVAPASSQAVHAAIRDDLYFKFYSGLRVNAQEMVWDSVRSGVERERARLHRSAAGLTDSGDTAKGSLTLDPDLTVPEYVDALDVHLMPGNYHGEAGLGDMSAGAIYDNGLSVFSMGLMGSNLDDIGRSVAGFIAARYPDFKPRRIIDMGCTIGHNTLPWASTYPDAEVTGIDVAAPVLRYAHARAVSQGVPAHFVQADAGSLPFPDGQFDVVFSSMFLHELPKKTIARSMAEAHRVLAPGGLMVHMELPPNDEMSAYDGFYLDWDCWYNQEPFYKGFRDLTPRDICTSAGFAADKCVQFVIPSREGYGEEVFQAAAAGGPGTVGEDTTGRLADGVQWFAFGAWK